MKRALVTGAAGGIGFAVVEHLLGRGYLVVAHDLFEGQLGSLDGHRMQLVTGDLLTEEGLASLRDALGEGPLDCVIATHGIGGAIALADLDTERVRRILRVNAATMPALLDLTLPVLRASGGAFVVFSSQAGLVGEADNSAYCASKFALVGWVRALAPELRREGVRIHAICPGDTKTELLFVALRTYAASMGMKLEEYLPQRLEGIPIGRQAEAAETAAVAVYLAEPGVARPVILAPTGGKVLY